MWKVIIILVVLGIVEYRERVIRRKLETLELSPEKEREMRILAKKVMEKAEKEGIKLPSHDAAILKLDDEHNTWIILKLGIRDKEIYRCNLSVEEINAAMKEGEKT